MINMTYLYILLIAIIVIVGLIFWIGFKIEDPIKRAGRRGEEVATDIICTVLNDEDNLLTNVQLSFDGNKTEIDNIVINNNGVFIIEVKNYVGDLVGESDDYEWRKYKITASGDIYEKKVKNPIKQVNRQIYILSNILKKNGFDVWVEGYVMLLERNSPVDDDMILWSTKDIDRAVHYSSEQHLSNHTVDKITRLLG